MSVKWKRWLLPGCLLAAAVGVAFPGSASSFPDSKKRQAGETANSRDEAAPAEKAAENDGKPVPLNKGGTVLLDAKGKRILLKAKVVFRDGLLEMLCCLKQTKEHESILSVDAKAYVIHTGLLALGAQPGKPVQFDPEFQPPTGQKIDIFLQWTDQQGKLHRDTAQSWVRHAIRRFYVVKMESLPEGLVLPEKSELRFDKKHQELTWYGPMSDRQRDEFLKLSGNKAFRQAVQSFFEDSQPREMKADWVFAGSGVYVDEKTGEKFYQAEGGDLICVANFPTAMIDVAMQSSATGEESLLFEAYTERLPPEGTDVLIELVPVFKKPAEKGEKPRKSIPD